MTYVGKILVIVIMVFAILFLAFSVVVFTTEMNWKTRVDALTVEVQNLKSDKTRLNGEVTTQISNVKGVQDEQKKDQAAYAAQLKDLTDQNNRRTDEVTKQRAAVAVAIENVKKSQDEAEARIAEANILRENLQKVQLQSNEFKLQKTELDQKILLLQKDLEVAQGNNKSLRDRLALLDKVIAKAGISGDFESYVAGMPPPPPQVEGEVKDVSTNNQVIEITIGSDDGVKVGQEFQLYSEKPTPEYLGKVKIIQADVDQAVARVIGKTIHGKKIQRGDHVTSKISPRG